jgi:hypothetical protein
MKRVWGITTVALLALTGCAPTTTAAPAATESAPASSLYDRRPSQEQIDALWAYVDAERAAVPKMLATTNMDDVYSEVGVESKFATGGVGNPLPDGLHAVVMFEYTFLPDYDLSMAHQSIDASKAQIDELCETWIFPRMRALGVDPPLAVKFTYHAADRILPIDTLWCSTSR